MPAYITDDTEVFSNDSDRDDSDEKNFSWRKFWRRTFSWRKFWWRKLSTECFYFYIENILYYLKLFLKYS